MIHEGAIGAPIIIRMIQNKHIKDWNRPPWDQVQYLINMIEEDFDAVPTIDEVYSIFKIALEAGRAVVTGQKVEWAQKFDKIIYTDYNIII